MIDIHAHFDREKDKSGIIGIQARGTVPDICSDIEIIVAHIIKGLAKQLPEKPENCYRAAMLFTITSMKGAKRGLRDYKEEQ